MDWKQFRLLTHWPLPSAVISIVTYGAVVAQKINLQRLGITYLLIFFGLVCAAYAFDALVADWRDQLKDVSRKILFLIASIGVVGFLFTVVYAIQQSAWFGVIVAGLLMIFIITYNLEIPKWMHNKWGFAIAWGGVPAAASYLYQTLTLNWIMLPLFGVGILLAFQEWFTTNTKSPIQTHLTNLKELSSDKANAIRKEIRKQTFLITSLFCYSNFALAMTLLVWRIYG
jgi:hypothetical protein